MRRLGIITGMSVEAVRIAAAAINLAEDRRPLIAAVGGDAGRAKQAALEFADAGVAGLVSFGIAGGLDPRLAAGDIVLAETVWQPDGTAVPTHAVWRQSVTEIFGRTLQSFAESIAGMDSAAVTAADKAKLRTLTGAAAVDMESHGVAAAALEAGLPLLAVRAIADPASRSVPRAALAGIGPDGERKPFAVLARLLANPAELPALIRVARDSNAALKSLSVAAPHVLRTMPD